MFCNPNINLISRTAEKCVHRKEGETGNYAGEIERREKMELVELDRSAGEILASSWQLN